MKRLICCLLCVVLVVGCGAEDRPVPVKDGRFQITYQDLVDKVDQIFTDQGMPISSDMKAVDLSSKDGVSAVGFIAEPSTNIVFHFDEKSDEIISVILTYGFFAPQENAAKQMGRYAAAFAKSLSPKAKLNIDIEDTLANIGKETVYIEDNMKIHFYNSGVGLNIFIEPNE